MNNHKKKCQFMITSTNKQCKKYASHKHNEDHNYCHWHQCGGTNYFKDDVDLQDEEKKWCRCVLHVAAKQNDKCLENVNQNAMKVFEGKTCYNPYAICSASIGTSSRKCGMNYSYDDIPDNELIAYAQMKKIQIPKPYSREHLIQAITKWKKLGGTKSHGEP